MKTDAGDDVGSQTIRMPSAAFPFHIHKHGTPQERRCLLFQDLPCDQFIDHVGKSDVPAHQALLAAEVESTYLMSSTSLPISL